MLLAFVVVVDASQGLYKIASLSAFGGVMDTSQGIHKITFSHPPPTSLTHLDLEKRLWNNGWFSEHRKFGQYTRWAENMLRGTLIGVFEVTDDENLMKLSELKYNASHRFKPSSEIRVDRRRH